MSFVRRLVKILPLMQCLLLLLPASMCKEKVEKEIILTPEQEKQNGLNLADFVKCPFSEEFDSNTNLEKYVTKKFGKPDSTRKVREMLYDYSKVVADKTYLTYEERYEILIYRGVFRKFEVFKTVFILDFTDIKHGMNKETTIKDIERLFGPREVQSGRGKENNSYSDTIYSYTYSDDGPYTYNLDIGIRKKKLRYISIDVKINDYKL